MYTLKPLWRHESMFLSFFISDRGNVCLDDMRAFQFLFKHMNFVMARKIEQSEVKFTHLRYYKKALAGKTMRRGKLFVHLDLGSAENPDTCVHISDFFLRVESVRWSVVSGIYNEPLS